jgi:hypothetical protein
MVFGRSKDKPEVVGLELGEDVLVKSAAAREDGKFFGKKLFYAVTNKRLLLVDKEAKTILKSHDLRTITPILKNVKYDSGKITGDVFFAGKDGETAGHIWGIDDPRDVADVIEKMKRALGS